MCSGHPFTWTRVRLWASGFRAAAGQVFGSAGVERKCCACEQVRGCGAQDVGTPECVYAELLWVPWPSA